MIGSKQSTIEPYIYTYNYIYVYAYILYIHANQISQLPTPTHKAPISLKTHHATPRSFNKFQRHFRCRPGTQHLWRPRISRKDQSGEDIHQRYASAAATSDWNPWWFGDPRCSRTGTSVSGGELSTAMARCSWGSNIHHPCMDIISIQLKFISNMYIYIYISKLRYIYIYSVYIYIYNLKFQNNALLGA